MSKQRALIIGTTGMTGGNLAAHLVKTGEWEVHGLSRRPGAAPRGTEVLVVDVRDRQGLADAARRVSPTHLFYCTWSRQNTEAENIVVNGEMVRNVLEAFGGSPALRHVALVTGLKHYLGPFETYAKEPVHPPFRETAPRLSVDNFYYEQEDILFAGAKKFGWRWSVHRPHTVIGYVIGNTMNMGTTLAAYAAICRETSRPFVFPGSPEQYSFTTDITDARLLARHLAWAATSSRTGNEAFNVVNGDTFHWHDMWKVIAKALDVQPAEYPGQPTPLEEQMVGAEDVWTGIKAQHHLVRDLPEIANWWHTDSDLGRQIETYADMSKSRQLGFTEIQSSDQSFIDLFARLRQERVIP